MLHGLMNLLSGLALLGGGFFIVVGAVGVLRMPDFYTRMHAASITDTLGTGLIILGLLWPAGLTQVSIKLLLILIFFLLTSPTTAHALARAAWDDGLKPVLTPPETPSSNS